MKRKNPSYSGAGTTKSGKPIPSIYSSVYTDRYKWPKWNREITVEEDPKLMRRVFVNYTAQDHKDAASQHMIDSVRTAIQHGDLYAKYAKSHGESGPTVSGIFQGKNFPEGIKEILRVLARQSSKLNTTSHAHWKASGARSAFPYNPPGGWSYSMSPPRKNPNTLHDRTEFSNRRNMPYVEVKYMPGSRMNTTELSLRGKTIASKVEMLKRGKVVSVDYWLPPFHGDPLGHLPVRKNPRAWNAKQRIYVNTYETTRSYGGPEEGGWWYTEGEPVDSDVVFSKPAAEALQKKLEKELGISILRPGRSPYAVYIEDHPARRFPATRPHYE